MLHQFMYCSGMPESPIPAGIHRCRGAEPLGVGMSHETIKEGKRQTDLCGEAAGGDISVHIKTA